MSFIPQAWMASKYTWNKTQSLIMAYPVLFEVALPTSLISYPHSLLLAHYAWLASLFSSNAASILLLQSFSTWCPLTWDNFVWLFPSRSLFKCHIIREDFLVLIPWKFLSSLFPTLFSFMALTTSWYFIHLLFLCFYCLSCPLEHK